MCVTVYIPPFLSQDAASTQQEGGVETRQTKSKVSVLPQNRIEETKYFESVVGADLRKLQLQLMVLL